MAHTPNSAEPDERLYVRWRDGRVQRLSSEQLSKMVFDPASWSRYLGMCFTGMSALMTIRPAGSDPQDMLVNSRQPPDQEEFETS